MSLTPHDLGPEEEVDNDEEEEEEVVSISEEDLLKELEKQEPAFQVSAKKFISSKLGLPSIEPPTPALTLQKCRCACVYSGA